MTSSSVVMQKSGWSWGEKPRCGGPVGRMGEESEVAPRGLTCGSPAHHVALPRSSGGRRKTQPALASTATPLPAPRKSCKELKREQMKEDGKIKESLQEEDLAQQTMGRLLRGGGTPQRGTDSGARRLKKLSAALSQPRGYEKNYVGGDLNLS